MNDIKNKCILAILVVALFILAGCGGGGTTTAPTTPPATTKIAGTASKGPISAGKVSIFAVYTSGVAAPTPLATVSTDSNGLFSADIGAYTGAITIEVSGPYTDEAKGSIVTIEAARPMRAAIEAVSPATTKRFAVTPLTDLAYSIAGKLTAQNITAANARVSGLFKIYDITGVEPVQPTSSAMNLASVSQQSYTLVLATLSQMAKSSNLSTSAASFGQIDTILNSFKSDLAVSANSGLGTANTNAFYAALGVTTNGTLTGFDTATATLGSVGTPSLKLTLTAGAIPSGTLIGGIQGKITFPAGTNVRLNPVQNGTLLSGLFTTVGSAAASLSTNSFVAPVLTFGIINASGFTSGDFATFTLDVSSGSPAAANFTLSDLIAIDINGAPLNVAVIIK